MNQPEVKSNTEYQLKESQIVAINQDPQGILNKKNQTDQDSPGILTAVTPRLISRKEYKSLPVNEIIQYKGIDDYIEPTTSIYPTVVKTPTHCYCIDGYDLIEKAIQEKSKFILCHIIYISTESEIELAIRKTATRIVSEAGEPYYAELVRNCRKLSSLLIKTTENPIMYSHGGKRKGINYCPDNKEENIRILMAERLGKSDSTVNKYLNYGENLDESILDTLVQSKEGKKFFEAVASNKRCFIKNLKCEGKDEAVITEEVSLKMAAWLEEFHEKGKIKPLSFEISSEPEKKKCLIDPPKPFEHHGEIEHEEEEISEQSLRQSMQSIGLAIFTDLSDENFGSNESVELLKNNISQALILVNKLRSIMEVA